MARPISPSMLSRIFNTRLTWPVYGFKGYGQREKVAEFLDWSAAADFAMHPERNGYGNRNFYVGGGTERAA